MNSTRILRWVAAFSLPLLVLVAALVFRSSKAAGGPVLIAPEITRILKYSPDQKYLVYLGFDSGQALKVFARSNTTLRWSHHFPKDDTIVSLAVSNDSQYVYSLSISPRPELNKAFSVIQRWNIQTGQNDLTLSRAVTDTHRKYSRVQSNEKANPKDFAHAEFVSAISLQTWNTPDLLLIEHSYSTLNEGEKGTSFEVLDLKTGECEQEYRMHESDWLSAVSPKTQCLLLVGPKQSYIYSFKDKRRIWQQRGAAYGASRNFRFIYLKNHEGSFLWDRQSKKSLWRNGGAWNSQMEFSPDDRWLAISVGGKVTVRDVRTGQIARQFLVTEDYDPFFITVSSLTFSPDSSRLVTSGHTYKENHIKEWRLD